MKKYSNKYLIETGVGLQDVDGLKNSEYFINKSKKYIKGEITLDELDRIITAYYKEKPTRKERTKEADLVAIRISKLIEDDSFTFTVGQLLSIHKYLFKGIIKNAGVLRTYNITKEEWVLDNAAVAYGDYRSLKETLDYDFNEEKTFSYKGLTIDETIEHLAAFISNLWQIHIFEEGNTRTIAVFLVKYLRSLGFDVTNDTLAKNAWYFRNSLVRSNYNDFQRGIYEDKSYLISILRNLILNERNKLNNRELHINNVVRKNLNKEERVLKLIRKNPNIKEEEMARTIKVSLRTVKSIVDNLKNEGRIERVNGKRYGYWKVKK